MTRPARTTCFVLAIGVGCGCWAFVGVVACGAPFDAAADDDTGADASPAERPDAVADAPAAPDASDAKDGGDGGDGGDGSVAALTCAELGLAYEVELPKTLACSSAAPNNECTTTRERVLGCECFKAVNASALTKLDAIIAAWADKSCVRMTVCPAVSCPKELEGGTCQATGGGAGATCVDAP